MELCRFQPKQDFFDPIQSRLRFFQTCQREVQLFPVPDRHQKIPDRERVVTLVQKIAKRKEIAFGLRHLLAIDEQMFTMDPEPDKGMAGRSLALGDLVFMMRKQQIDPAAMQIECVTKILHRHCRTLQMPARPAFTKRRGPAGLPRILGGFP